MLLGVLSFVDLAGGVVSFAHPAGIRHSCGAQNTVTAHSLWEKHIIAFDNNADHTYEIQHPVTPRNKWRQLKTTIIHPSCGDRSTRSFSRHLKAQQGYLSVLSKIIAQLQRHMISSSRNLTQTANALISLFNQTALLSRCSTFQSLTSHSPSMQTLELSCEQSVPSLTLLAKAKKKS